jgi:hypothetical protein
VEITAGLIPSPEVPGVFSFSICDFQTLMVLSISRGICQRYRGVEIAEASDDTIIAAASRFCGTDRNGCFSKCCAKLRRGLASARRLRRIVIPAIQRIRHGFCQLLWYFIIIIVSALIAFFTMSWWLPSSWYRALLYAGRRPSILSRKLNSVGGVR